MHMPKIIKKKKHRIQKPKRSVLSQQLTTRLQGTDTNNKRIHKKAPPWNGQYLILEGLNMFEGTNLTVISNVNHDK